MAVHDLLALFRLGMDPWEVVLRSSAVYGFLFLLFRFVLRRDAGSLGIADILLVVLIADASQNAMAGSYETVTDGFLLTATIAAGTGSWMEQLPLHGIAALDRTAPAGARAPRPHADAQHAPRIRHARRIEINFALARH